MPARRPHKKSRKGCINCKKRHIKCDEKHPTCTNCTNYGTVCSFSQHLSPPISSRSTPDSQTTSSKHAAPSNGLVSTGHNELNVGDLELLHHFTTVTCYTLSSVPSDCRLWQTPIVKEALDHPFLLRGILALAAFHLSRLKPAQSTEYIVKASTHQDLAIFEFRPILQKISASNCLAVFLFSGVLALETFASMRSSLDSNIGSLDGMLHCIHLVRGIEMSLTAWMPTIQMAEASGIICFPGCEQIEYADVTLLDYETKLVFSQLDNLCGCVSDPGAASAYAHAVKTMRNIFATVENPKTRSTVAITAYWLYQISHTYVLLLRERVPEALVVLAHYAVLLHRHDSYWYFDGWGRQLVRVIGDVLGPSWNVHLEWPRRMVGLGVSHPGVANIG
ncbi:hypothetical protein F5884DRAFT_680921 [Xylogone sp. PMI_703]|nr:hypothetical protein F5884DRAFT_680921 [Xylogone sp. PMI_703]